MFYRYLIKLLIQFEFRFSKQNVSSFTKHLYKLKGAGFIKHL